MKYVFSIVLVVSFVGAGTFNSSVAQGVQRPMIWVKASDRKAILDKIESQAWAADYYQAFKKRVESDLLLHQQDAGKYLDKMPLDWTRTTGTIPPILPITGFNGEVATGRLNVLHYMMTGVDCAVLYFLTDDEAYAQLSLDVLHTLIEGLVQIKPNPNGHNGGGYLYPEDHLREAREIGAAVPIIYDFVYPFIQKGGMPYDIAQKKKVAFSHPHADNVFKTYIQLALEQGGTNNNWPVLESSSLVGNTLALSDDHERDSFLEYYLTKNTPHQDALEKVAGHYLDYRGFWPESLGYSGAVASLSTYLMTLLTKNDPTLNLGNKYPQIPFALTTPYYLTYPNGDETVLFGDGHRHFESDYDSFETAYHLGQLSQNQKMMTEFGNLLNSAIHHKTYDRGRLGKRNYGAEVYREPLHLLWHAPVIAGQVKNYPLPVTDELPFAGITLQRNLSPTGRSEDALMGFVGGGAHVHGHGSGMTMELYGQGYVLGPKAGRGTYTTDLHENYYRLFASHNTVVVNGASETDGGWVNLGINRVERIAAEPEVRKKPVSENYSFSTSQFRDDKGEKAEAAQERTLGIVRTSPTTGYYVDIFRSKSDLPDEYHDYIYRNLADKLILEHSGRTVDFQKDSVRFRAPAAKEWVRNRTFRHPGWHFFKQVETARLRDGGEVTALFSANRLGEKPVKMKLFINNPKDREYTRAVSPLSREVAKPYGERDNPTLVIRQKGGAWQQPFAVVYEPYSADKGSVESVESIRQNNVLKALKITSNVSGNTVVQYVIVADKPDASFEDEPSGISFTGRYGVVTLTGDHELQSVYVGEGSGFRFKKARIQSDNQKAFSAFVDFTGISPKVSGPENLLVTSP
ncbi:heparinase II/III domain-containing protein [Persicitalea jodogahamensis]|nr:heparinase II/III family protein [Persicitalea jodogahamensis]